MKSSFAPDPTTEKTIRNNKLATLSVGAAESADITAIFSIMAVRAFLLKSGELLSVLAARIAFPIAAGLAAIKAMLLWRQVQLEGRAQHNLILRALVETAFAAAAIAATVIALAYSSLVFLGMALGPVIFTAALAIKSAYHFVNALFQWGKSRQAAKEGDDVEAAKQLTHARNDLTSGIGTGLASAAIGLTMLLGWSIYVVAGIASGVIGLLYCAYNGYKTYQAKQAQVEVEKEPLMTSTSTADLTSEQEHADHLGDKPRLDSAASPALISSSATATATPSHRQPLLPVSTSGLRVDQDASEPRSPNSPNSPKGLGSPDPSFYAAPPPPFPQPHFQPVSAGAPRGTPREAPKTVSFAPTAAGSSSAIATSTASSTASLSKAITITTGHSGANAKTPAGGGLVKSTSTETEQALESLAAQQQKGKQPSGLTIVVEAEPTVHRPASPGRS